MKILLITDQHFGARNDSIVLLDYYEKFYSETVFPSIEKEKPDVIIDLGDTFDRRKYVNFNSLKRSKDMWFSKVHEMGIPLYMIVGNHTSYYKNTNQVNTLDLCLGEYSNITILSEPTELEIFGTSIIFIPWINSENYANTMKLIENTNAKYCFGHLEINGFIMHYGSVCSTGLDKSIFDKFDMAFSGHFHHKSFQDNFYYLGNPYQLNWGDYGDDRGFHYLEIESTGAKLKFIKNENSIFKKIFYNDEGKTFEDISNYNFSDYKNCDVKVIVENKNNPYWFDVFIDNLYKSSPFQIRIVENFDFDIENEDFSDSIKEHKDTISILNTYVDNLELKMDKNKLKSLLAELYGEALNMEHI